MNNVKTNVEDFFVEVTVAGVRADASSRSPELVLRETVGGRELLIGIGSAEAMAIAFALQDVPRSRPMTHDVLKETLAALGQLLRIVIGFEAATNTFTADVVLALTDGSERHLDWRVSDAAAVAVRCLPRPTILIAESILAAPPPSILRASEVRCQCGEAIPIDADAIQADLRTAGHAEVDVECPACGVRRLLRFGADLDFGGQQGR